MRTLEGLDVLALFEYDGVQPQLVLGCEGALPDDSVERITNYLAARLKREHPDMRIYSNQDQGVVEVYSVVSGAEREEQLQDRFIVSPQLFFPGRLYVSSRNPEFLRKVKEE